MSLGLDPIRTVRDVGIDQYKAGLGEYLGAVASDAWANGPLSQGGRLLEASFANENARDRGETLLSPQEASDQGRELGLRFDQPIAAGAFDVLANEKRRQVAAEETFKRARLENGYGTLHWLLGGGTEFLTQAADPLNLASAFVPVVGEARYAMMASRLGKLPAALLKGAAEGAAGQALLEPIAALHARQQGDDYSMLETLMDVGFGAGLGVALHGAAYGAGAGFRFIRDRFTSAVPERAAPDGALPTQPTAAESPTFAREETPPPRQPVAEAMETLRPETKDAAMRTAVAQLLQDKPVDVEPVLAADPGWHAVRMAIELGHSEVPELQARSVASRDLPTIEPPAGFKATPEERLAAMRLARGWTPEPALDKPLSLSEFVAKRGGIAAETSEGRELAELLDDPKLARKMTDRAGRGSDELARSAQEHGYRFGKDTGVGNGVDVQAFENALAEEAAGRGPLFPEDAHTEAWLAQQDYFKALGDYLADTLGIDPKGMDADRLAWLMRQDADTARLVSLLDRADRLGPNDSLELANRLDREAQDLERQVLEEAEPGSLRESEITPPHDYEPVLRAELEAYHAEFERSAGEDRPGRHPAGAEPVAGRPAEGGEAAADRPHPADDPAAAARLRQQEEQGAGRAQPRGPNDLGEFAERQQGADLHADSGALSERDARLEGEAAEADALLADAQEQYGHLLDDADKAVIDSVSEAFDNDAKAIDALARCQLRGGA